MIALTSAIAKVYHQVVSDRSVTYLLANNLIDIETQKAFLPKVNGCLEHGKILNEIVANARKNHKTVHISFLDLADAFGSVSHELIRHTLERNKIPPNIVQYVTNLYSLLNGKVKGPSWESEPFRFQTGTFQGDPLSPVLFIMVFNPIISKLKSYENKYGYSLNNTNYITLPYADDFNLITTDKRRHQRILNEIQEMTSSMNLTLKPTKCRSISICGGSPKEVLYKLGDAEIGTVKEKPEKFLGSVITFNGSSSGIFKFIHDKLNSSLVNIDNSKVRGEYKVRVYKDYLLHSLRFSLTFHDLPKTSLQELDMLTRRYLKSG